MFNLNPKRLTFQTIQTQILLRLKNCDINKATGIGNLSGRFLKDRADINHTFNSNLHTEII